MCVVMVVVEVVFVEVAVVEVVFVAVVFVEVVVVAVAVVEVVFVAVVVFLPLKGFGTSKPHRTACSQLHTLCSHRRFARPARFRRWPGSTKSNGLRVPVATKKRKRKNNLSRLEPPCRSTMPTPSPPPGVRGGPLASGRRWR